MVRPREPSSPISVAAVVVLRLRRARPSGQSTVTAEPLSEEAQAEEAKAAEMAAIYGSAPSSMDAVQAPSPVAYASPRPTAPLDPMAQSLLGESAGASAANDSMAALEALVGDGMDDPVAVDGAFEPVPSTESAAAPSTAEKPSATTASVGGRLELPAGLADMLEEATDGSQ